MRFPFSPPLLLAVLAVAGCGDRDADSVPLDGPAPIEPAGTGSPRPDAAGDGATAVLLPDDTASSPNDDRSPLDDTDVAIVLDRPDELSDAPAGTDPDPGAGTNEEGGAGGDAAPGDGIIEVGDGPSGTSDPDETSILVPAIPGNVDAARVLDGLRLALGWTLLDLNERLNGGVELSDPQDACLGAHDPALGEPLFAIDCGAGSLVTEPVGLDVERGAFHATDACRADLVVGRTDECVIARASVFIRPLFAPFPGERLPRPLPGSGVVIRYAIDGPVLEVASDALSLTGRFACRIDLATGTILPGPVGSCDAALRDVATRLDDLLAAVR